MKYLQEWGTKCVYKNPGHMTKTLTSFLLSSVLLDSQVSDHCLCVTCSSSTTVISPGIVLRCITDCIKFTIAVLVAHFKHMKAYKNGDPQYGTFIFYSTCFIIRQLVLSCQPMPKADESGSHQDCMSM